MVVAGARTANGRADQGPAGRSRNGTKDSKVGTRPRDGISEGSEVGLRTTLDGMRTSPGGGRGPGARGVDVISVEESIAGVNARTGSTAGSVRAEKREKTRERAKRPRARPEARTIIECQRQRRWKGKGPWQRQIWGSQGQRKGGR